VSDAATDTDPFVGHVLATRYRIDRIIADGGMGRVYEGVELGTERRIAIKILHQDIAQDAVNIERFKREAETSQALESPYVVQVFDFAHEKPAPGRQEGAWFLVMEFLDGVELRAVLDKEKTIAPERAVRIIAQAAIALDSAHSKGFVHRDLKPDNLFLVKSPKGDHVKLLDFGSVKFTRGQDRGQKLTVLGTTIGSPFYMSPEQARGAVDLDHRTDVWALGAILYEMVVGRVPFFAANGPQILFKILGEEPEIPSFANESAPPELDDVITRALAKDRDKRFQSCGEFANAVGAALGLPGTAADWAAWSESEIAAKIAENRAKGKPSAASPGAAPISPANASDPGVQPTVEKQPAPAMSTTVDSSVDESIVKPSSPMGIYLAVGLGIVLVLAVIAALMLR
jgi:serine/threonine-protein kinase